MPTRPARDPRVTLLYLVTFAVAMVAGMCALVALVAGSPLQFGVALAFFGAGWIASDFIDRTGELGQERFARQHVAIVARPAQAYRPSRVVHTGHRDPFPRSAPRATSAVAA